MRLASKAADLGEGIPRKAGEMAGVDGSLRVLDDAAHVPARVRGCRSRSQLMRGNDGFDLEGGDG